MKSIEELTKPRIINTFKQDGQTMVAIYDLREVKSLEEFIEDSENVRTETRDNTKDEVMQLLYAFKEDLTKVKLYKSNEQKVMGQVELLNSLMEMLK